MSLQAGSLWLRWSVARRAISSQRSLRRIVESDSMTSPRRAKMLDCLLGAPASRRHSDLRSLPKASGALACLSCGRKVALGLSSETREGVTTQRS